MLLVILFLLPAVFHVITIVVTRVYIKSEMLRLNVRLGNSLILVGAMLILNIITDWGIREILAFFLFHLIFVLPAVWFFPARKYPSRDIRT